MAMKLPQVIPAGIAILILLLLPVILLKNRARFRKGVRAANTAYVKRLSAFKQMLLAHRVLKTIAQCGLLGAFVCSLLLSAQPYKTETTHEGVKKRDIFLCMDVSASTWSLNTELVHELKDVIAGLNGDRFGVLIFNTSPLLYVPMTDDYDFVNMKLDELLPFFAKYEQYYSDFYIYAHDDGYLYFPDNETRNAYDAWREEVSVWSDPVTIDNNRKGSSLIGVGLASCLYSFPRFATEDRTRVIIMSTDNAEEALQTPLLDLAEATSLCRKNNVTVFGIFPDLSSFRYAYEEAEYDDKRTSFKENVELTGGAYYEQSSSLSVSDIVEKIRQHEAMRVDDIIITRQVDQPALPLLGLMVFLSLAFLGVTALGN